jgi:hypothetical protein
MTSVTGKEERDNRRHEKPEVVVTYNGLDKDLDFQPESSMQALLEHALNAFDVRENRHTMALFTVAGVELPIEGSVAAAGVRPGDVLVLRPSAVRGG